MPLNKHKIFYVLLSFLIDEVNHTAQPKIVAAYIYTHNYNFRSGEKFRFLFFDQKKNYFLNRKTERRGV